MEQFYGPIIPESYFRPGRASLLLRLLVHGGGGGGFIILFALITLGFLGLTACAAPFQGGPAQEEIEKADYGPPPSAYYREVIKAYFDIVLFDPYSAHIEYGQPEKAWWGNRGGLLVKRDICYGWQVITIVNAKNMMGGYTGKQRYTFCFRDGALIKVYP